eukprot:scaffold10291_cov293-Chaetoceros_neogracile.AAC.14
MQEEAQARNRKMRADEGTHQLLSKHEPSTTNTLTNNPRLFTSSCLPRRLLDKIITPPFNTIQYYDIDIVERLNTSNTLSL